MIRHEDQRSREARHFLDVCADLEARLAQPIETAYAAVGVAALLRQLLLDERRLFDVVNRDERVPVRFRVRRRTPPDGDSWTWVSCSVDPESEPGEPAEDVRVDSFLKIPVIFTPAFEVTVGDLISWAANARGGVHLGAPRGAGQTDVERIARALDFGGWDVPSNMPAVDRTCRPSCDAAASRAPPDAPAPCWSYE